MDRSFVGRVFQFAAWVERTPQVHGVAAVRRCASPLAAFEYGMRSIVQLLPNGLGEGNERWWYSRTIQPTLNSFQSGS
jgi:hypothetical protein